MKKLVLFTLFSLPLLCNDLGRNIYFSHGCYGCHGIKGEGIGTYPKLARKSKEYLAKKLNKLKNGIGQTSKRDLMIPFAKALNKKEIEEVSKYLSLIDINNKEEDIADEYLGGFGS